MEEVSARKAKAFLSKIKSGSGYGGGSGYGYGYGYGSGDGGSSGDGGGYGYGYGGGNGHGDGYGDGGGGGYGYGYGGGSENISSFNGRMVFLIDGIPCVFLSVFGDCAKVGVISAMSLKPMFVAIFKGFPAHGDTLKTAFADAKAKYDESVPLSERIASFWEEFTPGKKYEGTLFFEWHHRITGSCLAGRKEFIERHGLSVKSKFTPEEFIALCENDYGSDAISKLKKAMPKR